MYGPYLHHLNPRLIKKIGLKPGDKFWGLQGQDKFKGASSIKQITFGGFWNKEEDIEEPYGDKTIKYRSTHKKYDDIIVDGAGAYTYDDKIYGTGSGGDVVYIFAK
jgi:hypothetical protein